MVEERGLLRRRVEMMDSRLETVKVEKEGMESQVRSLKSELAAIKEFRSDLHSVKDTLVEEARQEAKKLRVTVKGNVV